MSYAQIAKESRIKVLEMIYKAQTSHIGSNFSCADIMAVLFEKIDLDKDKFVLSAGWKAAILYYHLWRKGRITEEQLNSYCQDGSEFIGLAEPIHPDIPLAGGSMGLGLPGAVGLALAKKLKGEDGKVYVLMSDGEMQIGTTWESILIAKQHKLTNLMIIVDNNGFQAMGKTEDILKAYLPGGLAWSANGHDYEQLEKYLGINPWEDGVWPPEPLAVICNTVKGKGISFMENNNLYHYKQLSKEEYNNALSELNG